MAENKAAAENTQPDAAQQDNNPTAGEGAAEGQEGAPQKGGSLKLILMIGVPVLLLIITGAVLYFLGIFGGSEEAPKHEEVVPIEEQLHEVSVFKLPTMLINLRASGKRTNFLKVTINLEVKGLEAEIKHVMEKLQPRIIDQFQTYLRELEVEDLQGSAGLQRLKEELLDRANAVTGTLKVQNVLFVELLVQ